MSVLRLRRAVATTCAIAGCGALVGGLAVPAARADTTPSQTTPLSILPTTTTVPPASTTTTTVPASTTTTVKPKTTTTTRPKSSGAGVPAVPVGGPPTTKPATPGPPPPPPNPVPVLTAVQTSLAQLTAISDYRPAEQSVAANQRSVTLAGATLLAAQNTLAAAEKAQASAERQVKQADSQLAGLAIAAYTGVGYATMAAEPPSVDEQTGTVATPGGLTGIVALDADEMLRVVAEKAKTDVSEASKVLGKAKKVTKADQKICDKARAAVAGAESNLLGAQQTLKLVTQAATNPGAAATIALPDFSPKSAAHKGSATTTTTNPAALAVASGGNLVDAAATLPVPSSPSIIGRPILTGKDLAAWYKSTHHRPNITVSIDQLANDYQYWGDPHRTGVRYDLAFAQSVVETGFFSFPSYGQLTPKDNNFAGIGACDTCAHGWTFKDAKSGVGAQLELLYEYASTKPLPKGVPNEIGGSGIGGCCATWMALAGKWASSIVYGISIMTVYNQMLSWIIPQRLQQVGLISPKAAAAKGPSLAPLPGGNQPKTSA